MFTTEDCKDTSVPANLILSGFSAVLRVWESSSNRCLANDNYHGTYRLFMRFALRVEG